MKIYFAGDSWNLVLREAHQKHFNCLPRVLKSYFFLKKSKELDEVNSDDLFLDSGAFSAWTKGVTITVEEYAAYIKSLPDRFQTISNLDVIGDFKAGMKNQRYLEAQGIPAIPVFHMSNPQEPYESLDDLCKEYDHIALGGVAGNNFGIDKKKIHLDKCWSILAKYFKNGKPIKVHGFGITSTFLDRYPFYSGDSTSWMIVARYGYAVTFKNGRIVFFDPLKKSSRKVNPKIESHLLGLSLKDKMIESVKSYKIYENYLTTLWEKRGIKWN